jgi:hypothetical protein
LKSIIDKHTKGRIGTELEELSRMENLWLMMIGHAVKQEVEGILVWSHVCEGRGCEYQCIYIAHWPIDFLRLTVAGRDDLSGIPWLRNT